MRYPPASSCGATAAASGCSGVRSRRAEAMVFAAARILFIGGSFPKMPFQGNRPCTGSSRGRALTPERARRLFVAIDLLALLVALLRLHRQRGDRAGFEPLQRDRLTGLLAIAVGVIVDALQRRVDLGDQLALPVASAQFDGAVGFGRSAVGKIRMVDVLLLERLQCD